MSARDLLVKGFHESPHGCDHSDDEPECEFMVRVLEKHPSVVLLFERADHHDDPPHATYRMARVSVDMPDKTTDEPCYHPGWTCWNDATGHWHTFGGPRR